MTTIRARAAAAAPWLALAAAVAPLLSIAATNILLAAALLAVLIGRLPLRYPPILLPLGCWAGGTLLSLAASGHWAAGLPQVKKFWVWLLPLALLSALPTVRQLRLLLLGWAAAAAGSCAWSIAQFVRKYLAARAQGIDFYASYVADRSTGAMSHWMTFGGGQMIVLAVVLAALLWRGANGRARWFLLGVAALQCVAILLNQTRSVWLASIVLGTYLAAVWRPKLVPLIPLLLAAAFVLSPAGVQQRMRSLVQPDARLDSNQHRVVTFRTGLRMIAARPLLGLGPEQVGPHFDEYRPPELPKPDGYYGHLHNIYVHYAAERGIPAMLALIGVVLTVLWHQARALRQGTVPAWLGHGVIAASLAVLVEGCFELNLGDSEVLMLWLGLLSAAYAALAARPARA